MGEKVDELIGAHLPFFPFFPALLLKSRRKIGWVEVVYFTPSRKRYLDDLDQTLHCKSSQ